MTIRVLDAFTIGGAQISGGRRTRDFNIENELEFTVKKAHQMTFGATITGSTYAVDEVRNTNGTFTFASLEMYRGGLPTTYTQRTINPDGSYSMYRFGWYLQDSYRVNRSVMINMALRHDLQTQAVGLGEFLAAHRRELDAARAPDDAAREHRRVAAVLRRRPLRADALGQRPAAARYRDLRVPAIRIRSAAAFRSRPSRRASSAPIPAS